MISYANIVLGLENLPDLGKLFSDKPVASIFQLSLVIFFRNVPLENPICESDPRLGHLEKFRLEN